MYQTLCRRTEFPKLGYIASRLTDMGIPWKWETGENGAYTSSFHALRILLVEESRIDDAWQLLSEKWSKKLGEPSKKGKDHARRYARQPPGF